jgi:hypothetical protein
MFNLQQPKAIGLAGCRDRQAPCGNPADITTHELGEAGIRKPRRRYAGGTEL